MKMTVCFGHCQRLMDAGLLAQCTVRSVKCEGSYTCDRFGPSQPQVTHTLTPTHTDTHTNFSSPCDMSGMAACHTGHLPLKGSLWITPHNSLHGAPREQLWGFAGGYRRGHSQWMYYQVLMAAWYVHVKKLQTKTNCADGIRSPSTWPHLTIYRSLHENMLLWWSTTK